jgi:Kef-type K+ transport system membrane component KefB
MIVLSRPLFFTTSNGFKSLFPEVKKEIFMETVITTSELFLIAMLMIFAIPYLVWRIFKTDFFAPLVVVQIIMGILLGPGVLGSVYPDYYKFVFNPAVIQSLNAVAWWGVMLFVFIAGVELDLAKAWKNRRESSIAAGFALFTPLIFGTIAGALLLSHEGWIGAKGQSWQFLLGIGMSCAVTALPILILLMEKLDILRTPIGQRILRYASLDDIAIWAVLALILLDWDRVGRQAAFMIGFTFVAYLFRKIMVKIPEADRWYLILFWLAFIGFWSEWSGLHFMVGAFLAGAACDSHWFDQKKMDFLRHNVLLVLMPVFFLSTGLRTNWGVGGELVFVAAFILLVASVGGKLIGVKIAGYILGWDKRESTIIGWLLQTKALIMIIFANVLLDKQIITSDTFTALLIMAVVSTMLTIPMVSARLMRLTTIVTRAD